jgi:hypothetical protein
MFSISQSKWYRWGKNISNVLIYMLIKFIIRFCFRNRRFCVKCEVNLDYIEHAKTCGYYSCAFVYKFKVIWLYESLMIMHDRISGACIDLIVSLDIRFQRLRFLVRFFIWSDMIMYDIDARSNMIGQESVIDLIIWFLALGVPRSINPMLGPIGSDVAEKRHLVLLKSPLLKFAAIEI